MNDRPGPPSVPVVAFDHPLTRRRAARRKAARAPVSAEDFYAAALDILGEAGPAGLTVALISERVGVTKGSFYHHFEDLQEFIGTFLEAQERTALQMLGAINAEPDQFARLSLAANAWSELTYGSSTSFRAWAYIDKQVAASQERMDRLASAVAKALVAALEPDPDRIDLIARQLYLLGLGLQQVIRYEPVEYFKAVVSFVETTLGVRAVLDNVEGRPVVTFTRHEPPASPTP